MKCTSCGNNVESSWKVCPFCGEKINVKKTCSSCGKELDPSWKACPFCGESVNKQSDFSSFSNSNSAFMDFEKQYKVNKEEEERIKKEKAEKERKEKEAKLAREKAAKERTAKEARERERIALEERRKVLIAQGSIPNLSSDKKTLTFGKNINYFGNPLITWNVLKIENGYAFVCYKYGLSTFDPYSPRENDCSWANSNHRKWMNETFYRNYFDDEARKYIVKAKTSDGCEDYIFSLTVGDIDKYFTRRIDSDGTKFYDVSNVWLRGVINHSKYNPCCGVKQYKGVPFINCAGLLDASELPWYKETGINLMPAMFVKLP